MTALEIIGMILLLFLLLSLLRVGVIVDFGGELRVRLRVGPVKLTVLPRKEKKAQKKAAEAAGKTPEEKTKPKAAGGHRLPKLSFPELRESIIFNKYNKISHKNNLHCLFVWWLSLCLVWPY